MKLLVTVERRYLFYRGKYYVKGIEDLSFFARYLTSFEKIHVLCRVERVDDKPVGYITVDHNDVIIEPIFTAGTGVFNFIKLVKLASRWRRRCIIIRTPGILAYAFSIYCFFLNVRFNCEVVADPLQEAENTTSYTAVNNLLSAVLPFIFNVQMRLCEFSSFVTNHEIQKKYLTESQVKSDKFNSSYSSIILKDEFYNPPELAKNCELTNLLFVGVLDRPFKGLDNFLKLISNLPVSYIGTVVGDGLLLDSYKKMATGLGISDRVDFVGYISSVDAKKKIYREADVFILTSRREGLPRVVIEAMANSKPCICSRVSGVLELIEKKYTYEIDDLIHLRSILVDLTENEISNMKKRNFQVAQDYSELVLSKQRESFFNKIINYKSI